MSLCKHPEEVCCSMTLYHGKVYCDNTNGFCQLHDEPPPETNADHIRSMTDEELGDFLDEIYCHGWNYGSLDRVDNDPDYHDWLKQPYKEAQ